MISILKTNCNVLLLSIVNLHKKAAVDRRTVKEQFGSTKICVRKLLSEKGKQPKHIIHTIIIAIVYKLQN